MFSRISALTARLGSFCTSRLLGHASDRRRFRRLFMEPLENRRLLAAVALDPSFGNLATPGHVATPGYVITPNHGSGDLLLNPSDGGIIEVNRDEIQRYDAHGAFLWSAAMTLTAGTVRAVLDAQGGILVASSIQGQSYTAQGVPGGTVHLDTSPSGMSQDFAVWRYNPDGTPDTSFGGGDGVATVDFPAWYPGKRWNGSAWVPIIANTSDDDLSDITIDKAGRIVLAGMSYTRDTKTLESYAIGPNGTPVLVPTLQQTTAFAVARLNPNGTPDTEFGEDMFRDGVRDGTVLTYPAADPYFGIPWLAGGGGQTVINGDNRIILAGTAYTAGTNSYDFGLVRYTDTGALDTTFGVDGFASANLVASDSYGAASAEMVRAMALDSHGRVIVLGSSTYENQGLEPQILVRFTANGTLDEGFGIQGTTTVITGPQGENYLSDLAIDVSDRIVTVGYKTVGYNGDGSPQYASLLARYKSDGNVDERFGDAGFFISNYGTNEVDLWGVAVDNVGRMVVAGDAWVNAWQADSLLARYLDPDPDGDGIESPIDTLPMTFSNDFRDGATTGTITGRRDQTISVVPAPNLADAVLISASPGGGPAPASITVDNGTLTIHSLSAGDQVTVAHGSVIVQVLAGSVELTLVSTDGQVGTTSLAEGNGVTFKPESFTLIAPATNTEPVHVVSNGSELTIGPGQTVRPVQIDVKPGDSNTVNLDSNGVIAVAIFSTVGFDASQVNVGSVLFAGGHAVQSVFKDVNGDGRVDLLLHFRTQDTALRSLYEQLLADDINGDGVLDSNHQTAEVSLTGETVDDVLIEGFDDMDLFLSGKKLRSLLDELATAGAI